jgi:hypothetical protein
MTPDLSGAIEARIGELTSLGGDCKQYAAVLQSSLASGRIEVRPYMWRVGQHLASAEARFDGQIALARDIDSLNVGVRTLDEITWSVEHEAAHVAFRIPSGAPEFEEAVNRHVAECRTRTTSSHVTR